LPSPAIAVAVAVAIAIADAALSPSRCCRHLSPALWFAVAVTVPVAVAVAVAAVAVIHASHRCKRCQSQHATEAK
jgi:uncharacterized protein (DUF983 family)